MNKVEKDSRIITAAAHWSHRMVTNGVPLADFQDVTNNIDRWEDWCSAWCERGSIHENLAKIALDSERFISTRITKLLLLRVITSGNFYL